MEIPLLCNQDNVKESKVEKKTNYKNFFYSMVATAVILSGFGVQSISRAAETVSKSTETYDFNIPSGDLSDALITLSNQSKLQIFAPSSLTKDKKNAPVSGRLSVDSVMAKLLNGVPLAYRMVNSNTILIYPRPEKSTNEKNVSLGAINIEGGSVAASGGGNGSKDVVATEGSNSYATNYVSIGSKAPQKYNEVTQSVSVLTQQRIEEQGIKSVEQALQNTTGVTRLQSAVDGSNVYYSRGFEIKNVTIDGGSAFSSEDNSILSNRDMSMYDSVELLRGADAFGNAGDSANPSGTINLVRKKPLDHNQLSFELSAGSWDKYRGSVDVTGPLVDDGKVRGRLVLTGEKSNNFYQNGYNNHSLAYGIIEADLTPNTLFTIGGSYSYTDRSLWTTGLPRYMDGGDLNLPRSYSLTAPDSNIRVNTREIFSKLSQKIGDNWTFNSQLTEIYTMTDGINDPIQFWDIDNNGFPSRTVSLSVHTKDSRASNFTFDSSLNGNFDVLGLGQNIEIGFNYNKFTSKNINEQISDQSVKESIFDYDTNSRRAGNFARDANSINTYNESAIRRDNSTMSGYARVDLSPVDKLHLITGPRWSYVNSDLNQNINSYFSGTSYPSAFETKYKDIYWNIPVYAVRYDFTPSWSGYASYTNVYEPQTELRTVNGSTLAPKKGNNQEIGVKYTNPKGTVNGTLAFYKSKIKNIAIQDSSILSGLDDCCYTTAGNRVSDSKGIDFDFQGEVTPWWNVSLGYTFNINKDSGDRSYNSEDDEKISGPVETQSPKHLLKFWNVFSLRGNQYMDKTKVGAGIIAQSSTYNTGYINGNDYNFKNPGYAVVSAFTSYDINKNLSLSINVNNIFDKKYYGTVGDVIGGNWYGEPRNFLVSITGKI
ncbi:TonB-dependent siderophore receptor [Serratia liquefaciens]|uniref:TonB-dependent siderophore receptor n=1 Tax=Serratia liquefaciens TaxID=614 RepID=UPI00102132D0|nr:TonB-dependent receptor [Serratia liquefaciens]RYM70449.1 hypothetical protein BSQ99_15070 [Serratia liquefaciens]